MGTESAQISVCDIRACSAFPNSKMQTKQSVQEGSLQKIDSDCLLQTTTGLPLDGPQIGGKMH